MQIYDMYLFRNVWCLSVFQMEVMGLDHSLVVVNAHNSLQVSRLLLGSCTVPEIVRENPANAIMADMFLEEG
jgi:hypothetical protein